MNKKFNNLQFPSQIGTFKHNQSVNLDVLRQLLTIHPACVFDFGCGDGFYGKLVKLLYPDTFVTGIEIEKTYINEFKLNNIYDEVYNEDMTSVITSIKTLKDLAIFGDCLEHLNERDMLYMVDQTVRKFKYTIINSPLGFQKHEHTISSENHRCGITWDVFKKYTVLEFNTYCEDTMFNCLLFHGRLV
jgi:SAM-dependent methyltransferase